MHSLVWTNTRHKQSPQIHVWQHHLCYATVCGPFLYIKVTISAITCYWKRPILLSQLFLCSSQYTSSDQWQLHGDKTEEWGQVKDSVIITFFPKTTASFFILWLIFSLLCILYWLMRVWLSALVQMTAKKYSSPTDLIWFELHCVPEKNKPKRFCHIFCKTWLIMMKFAI